MVYRNMDFPLLLFILISALTYTTRAVDSVDCPELNCKEPCKYGSQRDEQGCSTCKCLSAECQEFQCAPGKECMVFEDTHSKSQVPKCVDPSLMEQCKAPADMGPCKAAHARWFYDTDSDSCQEFTYGGCKGNNNRFNSKMTCAQTCDKRCNKATCYLYCEHGFMEDEHGCHICKCRTEPKPVPYGSENVFKVLPGCDTSEETECGLHCPNGYKIDNDGCMTCQCLLPPHCDANLKCDVTCEYGQREDTEGCPTCDCREKGECGKIDCYMECEYGRKLDQYGCTKCECKEDPCATIECEYGLECRAPNGAKPECVELVPQWIEGCPSIMCAMYCEHGFLSDRYGCNICQCKTKPSMECPSLTCEACDPDYGYVYDKIGCQTCECHKNPCLDQVCNGTTVCVADKQCLTCPMRPECVPNNQIKSVHVHMELTCVQLPHEFNKELFSSDIKKQLSDRLKINEEYFATFKVLDPSDKAVDVSFHLVDDNDDPAELHEAARTLKGEQQFQFNQTTFRSNPAAYQSTFYTSLYMTAEKTGESKEGQTTYIVIGCVVGGLVALMIGVTIALVTTKGNKNRSRPPNRKHNVIYQPTTYEDSA